ncbi:MAG: 50S ribosomal protein L25/general stress protein Ctc [Pseudomonadota bacterium]|nr:50S ribosomal protein L25/general stress protein Ctc [Pseudomonadota bacterium]
MADLISLAAEMRDRAGKGAARATRREGRVPAVIYGNKQDPMLISVDPVDLMHQLRGPGFFARVFEITFGGESYRVLARDLQTDPVSDRPIHVDFMRFSKSTRLVVDVEMVFENAENCPGIRIGGVLNVVRHTIELRCAPDGIPEKISVDLTDLEIGDSVHISDVTLPADVELTITDRDFTIATIAAPTIYTEPEEEEEGEEGEEGEVSEEGAEGEEAAKGEAQTQEGGAAGESGKDSGFED